MAHTKYIMDWFPSAGIQAIDRGEREEGKDVNSHAVKQNQR